MNSKLTVLIPCKNEQENIRGCIESALAVADEVLVADSGSTDRTLEIVRSLGGCRIIQRDFRNYANFKNWAIPKASCEWVLIVDADERITPELADEILDILSDPPLDIDGYWIYRRNIVMGRELRHSGLSRDKVCRLIRRDICRYAPCRVHERMDVPDERAGRLKHRMLHFMVRSYGHYFAKQVNYTRWRALDRWDNGSRTSSLRIFLRPVLRFLQLYFLRQGFRDGVVGLQFCMLQSFFVTFVKQGYLWELQENPQPDEFGTGAVTSTHRCAA